MPETERFAKSADSWSRLDADLYQTLSVLDGEQGQYEGVQISTEQFALKIGKDERTAKRRIDKALASGHLQRVKKATGTSPAIYRVINPSRRPTERGYIVSRIGRTDTHVRSWEDTDDTPRVDNPVTSSPDSDDTSTLTPQKKEEREDPSPLPQPGGTTVVVHAGAVREFLQPLRQAFPQIAALPERLIAKCLSEPLAAGWEPEPLGKRFVEMGQPIEGVSKPERFLPGRLRLLMSRHAPERAFRRPPHCGHPQCNPDNRLRQPETGLPFRCPECHPLKVGTPAPLAGLASALSG